MEPLSIVHAADNGEPDPAVLAFEEWRAAYARYMANFDRLDDYDDDPEFLASEEAERKAARRLAATVPTTLQGVTAQIAFAHYVFGEAKRRTRVFSQDGFEVQHNWLCDDREARLLRCLLAGVERMAGRAA